MASDADFDRWLSMHGGSEREIVVAIYGKASGKQTVTLAALQETAQAA
jgi:RecA/RadA recombinase